MEAGGGINPPCKSDRVRIDVQAAVLDIGDAALAHQSEVVRAAAAELQHAWGLRATLAEPIPQLVDQYAARGVLGVVLQVAAAVTTPIAAVLEGQHRIGRRLGQPADNSPAQFLLK